MSDGWVDRQMPEGDEMFLDHVGYFAMDLEHASDRLARLGFQVSAVNTQYNANSEGTLVPSGTSNRLVKLRRGFIEVLAATSETPLAEQLRLGLERYAGFHVVALTHPNMERQRERLVESGFAMQRLVNLRRQISAADGERQMAYTILRTEPGVMAEGRVQLLTTHTPDLFWTPGVSEHANQADALTDLILCVNDPAEAATRFSKFTARSLTCTGGLRAVLLDRGRLLFADAKSLATMLSDFSAPHMPFIAGQGIRSNNVMMTKRVLVDAGVVPAYADETLICVSPADALGGYLLFHAASVTEPWRALQSRI